MGDQFGQELFQGTIMKQGGFDVIIGNPPYVEYSSVYLEVILGQIGAPYNDRTHA